jgi:hypothetical protein
MTGGVSCPAGLIRKNDMNREMNRHQASEVWRKDVVWAQPFVY